MKCYSKINRPIELVFELHGDAVVGLQISDQELSGGRTDGPDGTGVAQHLDANDVSVLTVIHQL